MKLSMYSERELVAEWERAMRQGDFARAHATSALIRELPLPDLRSTPRHHQRIWDGRTIDGRVVFVRCYHGLGDTLQFVRFLPMVAARARQVHVWVQPALIPLLRGMIPAVQWHPLHDGDFGAPYDVDVEIMELPQLFGTTLSDIPAVPTFALRHRWTPVPAHAHRRRHVGLIWRAGDWAPHRSVPLTALRGLRVRRDVHWHSLQQGVHADSIVATARRMLALDLVITVDSMPAHLAGSLGVPVWTLLSANADWRWMEGRNDSPWYPTMRLFRQISSGNWHDVVRDVAHALGSYQRSPYL